MAHSLPHSPVRFTGTTLESTEEFIQKTHNFLRSRKGPQPHLEVETYTWSVLPDYMKIPLAAQIARELHYIETL